MENSRNSSSDEPQARLEARVTREIAERLFPGANLLLGLSGGVDSMTLLAVLAGAAPRLRFSLRAVHVDHGISPNSADWARFCAGQCAMRNVPLGIERVDVSAYRRMGPEAAARAARYAAYDRHNADFLVLAQHLDDQAETLLLQLMRGAGPDGLAGMAPWRAGDAARAFPHGVLRPMLRLARADILAYARALGLQWIEDESNARLDHDRNFLRLRVIPLIEQRYPHAREVAARSARHLAEAAQLLEQLAGEDIARLDDGRGLDIAALRSLGAARARNVIRHYCRSAGLVPPGAARLAEAWRQLSGACRSAVPRIEFTGGVLQRYRDRLCLEVSGAPEAPPDFTVAWNGEPVLPLPELGGALRFVPEEGRGVNLARLRSAPVTVRLRRGGERLQPVAGRPRRSLKNLLQEKGVAPWRRATLPLVYCGDDLVFVPGIGIECAWKAAPGERGLIVIWEPARERMSLTGAS